MLTAHDRSIRYRSAHGGKGLKIPPKPELVKLAGVVGIASVINATLVKEISEWAKDTVKQEFVAFINPFVQ